MTIETFITKNQKEIDRFIISQVDGVKLNDRERRLWILNDEKLYNWAKNEGVKEI